MTRYGKQAAAAVALALTALAATPAASADFKNRRVDAKLYEVTENMTLDNLGLRPSGRRWPRYRAWPSLARRSARSTSCSSWSVSTFSCGPTSRAPSRLSAATPWTFGLAAAS